MLPLTFAEWQSYFQEKNSVFGDPTESLFDTYLEKSGFPHLLSIDERELRLKLLAEDIVTKAIYKDEVEMFGLREPAVLEKLLAYLSASTSGLASQVKLASMLGIDRIQTGRYLDFLKTTLLVFPLSKYSRQIRESVRSQEKIHVVDQGLGHIYQAPYASILESVVARHLWELFPRQTYYFRERYEVDLVLHVNKNLLPIEIKNTDKIDAGDLSGLKSFAKAYGLTRGIVVYRGSTRKEMVAKLMIEFYPVWHFLLDPVKYISGTVVVTR